jgi:hypothetical protein
MYSVPMQPMFSRLHPLRERSKWVLPSTTLHLDRLSAPIRFAKPILTSACAVCTSALPSARQRVGSPRRVAHTSHISPAFILALTASLPSRMSLGLFSAWTLTSGTCPDAAASGRPCKKDYGATQFLRSRRLSHESEAAHQSIERVFTQPLSLPLLYDPPSATVFTMNGTARDRHLIAQKSQKLLQSPTSVRHGTHISLCCRGRPEHVDRISLRVPGPPWRSVNCC